MSSTKKRVISEEKRLKILEQKRAVTARIYAHNKANSYECPVCGRTINKSIVIRHNKTLVHKYAELQENMKQLTTQPPAEAAI